MKAKLIDSLEETSGVISIPLLPFKIEKDSLFEVIVNAEGYRKTTVLSRRIFQGEIPAT